MAKISFFALGGQDENGKNCYILEIDDNIFILNSGAKIPLDSSVGIDTIIADFTYIEENQHKVRGIFITDAKNESFSALPWLIMKLKTVKIYSSFFTKALIIDRISKYRLSESSFEVKPITTELKISEKISVFSFPVAGSMPGTIGFCFQTEDGAIVFMSNYVVGNLGVYGITDFDLIKKVSANPKGILMFISDSGKSNLPGKAINKLFAKNFLEKFFLKADKNSRIVVSAYDEEMISIQEIIDLSVKFNRQITAYGKKYDKLYDMIYKLDKLTTNNLKNFPMFFDYKYANKQKNSVILITSSPERICHRFNRILENDDVYFKLKKSDYVIMLTPPINGMEQLYAKVLDQIAKSTASIVDISESDFGLARPYKEDISEMIQILKPKYFLPIQGLYRYLIVASNIAVNNKIKKQNIIVLQNKRVANFLDGNLFSRKKISKGQDEIYISGFGVGDVSFEVLKERENLSRDGLIIISFLFDPVSKKILSIPEITDYGILSKENRESYFEIIRKIIFNNFSNLKKINDKILKELQQKTQKNIKRKLFRMFDKEPSVSVLIHNIYSEEKKMKKLPWKQAENELKTGVVYLEFAVDWCGDCKMQEPVNDELAKYFKDRKDVKLIKVDAEESKLFRQKGTKYDVLFVPTHFIFKNGEIVFKKFNYVPAEILIENIEKAVNS
ncbi:ribonuclease J [Mycoplasma flocculare]|uniref:Ribonuclease J n=1 Tax=Mesomycoplasma flocculare TaxID=2128 RepID=A0AAW9XAS9_MESFC|nr:thioredoxin domain-containing protein [Mesomycoplasma flocculare]MXR05634.1 ribonuclease J [Mesomycoplasma flocculare]MXR12004.1 ribonuclease J [Mesomycoplasma flocculare]MXR39221.1 ribonuclease J [Mycoplasma sp. MF12]MXR56590.1 ribonuclease J [Mesomycoplasma flocculare]